MKQQGMFAEQTNLPPEIFLKGQTESQLGLLVNKVVEVKPIKPERRAGFFGC